GARRVRGARLLTFAEEPLPVVRPPLIEDGAPALAELELLDRAEGEREHAHRRADAPRATPGRRAPSEELESERLRRVRRRFVVIERNARVLLLDRGDPAPGAIEQLMLVIHEPASRHQDAQVRARVSVLPLPGDPQGE